MLNLAMDDATIQRFLDGDAALVAQECPPEAEYPELFRCSNPDCGNVSEWQGACDYACHAFMNGPQNDEPEEYDRWM